MTRCGLTLEHAAPLAQTRCANSVIKLRCQMLKSVCLIMLLLTLPRNLQAADPQNDCWPQASGPNGNWSVAGAAPVKWSVVRNENIVWKSELPEGGQSAVTIWKDQLFLTCHPPLSSSADSGTSTHITGYCMDRRTGDIEWTVTVPGSVAVGTAGIFSDATVFAPVTDGRHVWFFNRSGGIGCFDMDGKQVWLREYVPRNRHTNREAEPILFGNQIITVEVLDKEAGMRVARHARVPADIEPRSVWTYLHGIDSQTGDVLWTEQAGTACHHTPMTGRLRDGTAAIVHARGGGHGPLEKPYGISLTSLQPGSQGKTLWSAELPGLDPVFNSHWNAEHVYAFHRTDHVVLDTSTGREIARTNLNSPVTLWKHNDERSWIRQDDATVRAGRKHANTNQANIVVGDWHYFLAHDFPAIGRVHTKTQNVEYLEVPVQISAENEPPNRWIWNADEAIPIETTNSRGINIAADKRATRTGWGHVSAASPTLVGHYLYFPVMTGTVYVIDTRADKAGPDALVAINDLGAAGRTWTLSSFSYADGQLFIRTMKEVICIGDGT